MLLGDLLKQVGGISCEARYHQYSISHLSCDSRDIKPESIFVVLSGAKSNGADFIADAISKGATVIVNDNDARLIGSFEVPQHIALIKVESPRLFLRALARAFYGNPSETVKTIGVTGTNGKTTITYLLESIIASSAKQSGVLGTINYRIGGEVFPSINTTPGFLDVQRFLCKLKKAHVSYCVMEASSHALVQGRLDGIDFAAAIFTNLTQDHLDYHPSMEAYFQAKSLLFTQLPFSAASIINADDPYGQRLMGLSKGHVLSYGIDAEAGVRAINIQYHLSGTSFDVILPEGRCSINTLLVGRYNTYNILASVACAYSLGFSTKDIVEGVNALRFIPGRLESVPTGRDFFVFIDYAHTDDGLMNVLKGLRTVSQDKIIVVFGCGGDRDKLKRPKMARAVSELSDYAIITSDNPRSEDPQAIINDIVSGFTSDKYEVCVDRQEAIEKALSIATKGAIVLLAGKGHETYQILKDRTIPFNERAIVETFLHVHH